MPSPDDVLNRITVILHHTRSAENVGAAARALANMGLGRLVLTEPEAMDPVRARVVATDARSLLDAAETAASLDAVWDRYALVIATSAKPREGLPALTPDSAAARLVEAAATGQAVALLFGDERTGLPRQALDRAHGVSTIRTAPGHASLNLAQAVLVHAYALREVVDEAPPPPTVPPMPEADFARLRDRARRLLLDTGYLNPDQPDRIFGELERLLVRARPTEREGRLLLALIRKLESSVRRPAPPQR